MLKATQQVGQLKNEPRSAQASFLCPCQASFRVTAQVICSHTIQEWCSECGEGSRCTQVLPDGSGILTDVPLTVIVPKCMTVRAPVSVRVLGVEGG